VVGPTEVRIAKPRRGTFVAAVIGKPGDKKGSVDLAGARLISEPGAKIKLPAGKWRVMTFTQEPTGGHIRGVHFGEDDGQPGAPPAADLLSFEAMQAFIRFCYDPYYDTLKDHFGKTVFAIFTDEPSLSGRGGRRGLKPWTKGMAEDFAKRRGYELLPLLPALFYDAGERTSKIREDFDLAVDERLDETYYQQLSKWCDAHKIALTGHPAHSDQIRPLRLFQIPGQDIVWRWVLPNQKTALEGAHSTVGKCSSSAARHDRRRRNGNELYGAYGWHVTMDEMKWLADWLIVRGVNLLYPHAFYYSIRGPRVHERPPDLGMHNAWWPYYRIFADYTSRLCGLMTDGQQVCSVAVLSVNNTLPWRAAKWLYQNQVDFNYLEDWRLCEQAIIADGRIKIGEMAYDTLIVDHDRALTGAAAKRVKAFQQAGGRVRTCKGAPSEELVAGLERDVTLDPPSSDLRYCHMVKDKVHFYLLVNEGEGPIDSVMTCRRVGKAEWFDACRRVGKAEWFDAWSNEFRGAAVTHRDRATMSLPLHLGRRESAVLCIDPSQPALVVADMKAPRAEPTSRSIPGPWAIVDKRGERIGDKLVDWRTLPGLVTFAGTLTYKTTFDWAQQRGRRCELDLGNVGDWAVVKLNGEDLGPRFWAPFQWDVAKTLKDGQNELVVEVTNSFANRYAPKKARPSGLMGPVQIKRW
jgi:hypothetical protein